jgi:hypothetical protein
MKNTKKKLFNSQLLDIVSTTRQNGMSQPKHFTHCSLHGLLVFPLLMRTFDNVVSSS